MLVRPVPCNLNHSVKSQSEENLLYSLCPIISLASCKMYQRHFVLLLFLFALFSTTQLFAQLENNYWFFGNSTSGVYFDPNNGSQPVANNVQYTPFGGEGCGVVTDPVTGQLLFYSDGERVLNRNNVPMPNGTTLGGCASSAQAVAFAPVPGSCNRYYIFSNTSGSGCPTTELRWSIVDMTLDNGLGDIEAATKNTLIRSDATEGMIMVQRPGFKEYWLIGKMTNNSTFYVYQITGAGINLAGQYPGLAAFNYNMQYSAVAGKLAVCYPSGPVVTYDFDANTGVLSNQVQVATEPNAYDAEFSPDGTKLYYSSWTSLSIGQYDFNTNTAVIIFTNGLRGGGLRTGPDGRIYHINNNTGTALAAINNPNAAGAAAGYVDNALNLGAVIGGLNLPEVLAGTIPDIVTGITTGTINNVSCTGANDGRVWAAATNGIAPYSYLWSNNATGDTLSNVGPGTYFVTVTDDVQCKVRDTVVITEPTPLSLTRVVTNAACAGVADGAIDITVTGGTAPYTYLWSNNATTEDLNNLSAGIYRPTATDANGCTITATITVAEPVAMQLDVLEYHTSCSYTADGEVEIDIIGGTAPYTWVWADGNQPLIRQGLGAGSYSVTVTDANGCTADTTATVNAPDSIALTISVVDVLCHGGSTGSITLSVVDAVGGAAAADYLWSNGAQTQNNANVAAGMYTVTVTDQNQCSATASATVGQPLAPLFLTSNQTYVLCNGDSTGAVDLAPSGGTPNYNYAWSNNATSEDINNVPAGTYSVSLTDANNCTATLTAIVQEPPTALSLTSTSVDATCNGFADGTIDLTPAGAVAPYTYLWSNASTQEDPINLAAGTYTVVASDANGCTATHTTTVGQPDELLVGLQATDLACQGDATATITSSVTGGLQPYSYTWSTGDTTFNLRNVAAGTYNVQVTDRNQCVATASVVVTEPDSIAFTYEVTDVTCFGAADGMISISTTGGTGIVDAIWVGGVYPNNIFTGISAGNYTIILRDENACEASFAFNVAQPDSIFVNIAPMDTLKVGQLDTILISEQINPGAVSYLWEPPTGLSCTNCATPEVRANFNTDYTLTIDNNGCLASDTVQVYVDGRIFYVPNAFSPNGDSQNDVLYVYAEGVRRIVWSVYNRWGEVVFTSTDINVGWDGSFNGKLVEPGVFIIDVYIEYLDLTSNRKAQSITLLR